MRSLPLTLHAVALWEISKQVKDPNLVGALSGHKEGSRAFARYRVTDGVAEANAKEIDEDMKRDLVSMLE